MALSSAIRACEEFGRKKQKGQLGWSFCKLACGGVYISALAVTFIQCWND